MRFFHILTLFALTGFVLTASSKPTNDKAEKQKILSAIQGVWEEVSIQTHKGRLEETEPRHFEFLKHVDIIIGDRLYRVRSKGSGAAVHAREIHLNPGAKTNSVSLVCPDTNHTIRCLFEISKEKLTLCSHGGRKTLLLPEKIAATPGAFEVHVYQKLLSDTPNRDPEANVITGVWETVAFEFDGEKLDDDSLDDKRRDYWLNEKVYYFQKTIYTMCRTEGSKLRICHKPYQLVPNEGKQALNLMSEDDQLVPAIYEWAGDKMKICYNFNGGARPTQFRTEKGDGLAIMHLRRVDTAK